MLVWIEGAPLLGISTDEEIAKFIMSVVSCALPEKKLAPILHENVTSDQVHKHNSYCQRSKKTNHGSCTVCRFGFDRPVTKEFVLRNVQKSVVGRRNLISKSRLYDLPRKENETMINDSNTFISLERQHGYPIHRRSLNSIDNVHR